jgi:hypothetical protein
MFLGQCIEIKSIEKSVVRADGSHFILLILYSSFIHPTCVKGEQSNQNNYSRNKL